MMAIIINKRLLNVLLLGLAFMLVFTAFQTMGNIQETLIKSIKEDDKGYYGSGYTSLSVIYATLSLGNWAAPSVISCIGPKFSMLFGGVTYLLFIMNFLLPLTWLLYVASVVIGFGAAMIWTGQGNYLALNSTPATISRNSGIFWGILQLSLFIGNIFVYFQLQGEHIDKDTRNVVIWTLTAICMAGLVVFFFLPSAPEQDNSENPNTQEEKLSPLEALKNASQLLRTNKMLLLSVTFVYTGLELSFFSGVYSSCIGYSEIFGEDRKKFVGLSGVFIGVGEVLGGAAFGILGAKTVKWGRDPIVICGFIVHVISYFLIFLNLPNNSPLDNTSDEAFISSSKELAFVCSFLLGFGDSCYNTQTYSILGGYYSHSSAAAFAIFKFTQSVAAAISFFYARYLILYGQLGILLIFAVMGTITFVYVEWSIKREIPNDAIENSECCSNDSVTP